MSLVWWLWVGVGVGYGRRKCWLVDVVPSFSVGVVQGFANSLQQFRGDAVAGIYRWVKVMRGVARRGLRRG